jgi:ABC-2 type transport system ATP-binding protein
MNAIETDGLTKRFGAVEAVSDLDLTVEEGEIYGFLGPNGAGKTTTINMLLSLVHPTSGSARIFGQEIGENIRETHHRIGVLPAHTDLYARLTARKHLEFVIGVKDADDDPDALLDRVGITDAADRPAGEFSSGMAQRLKLAMALVDDPELLILDEPTTGLDPNGAREMRQIITEENERGATVFFSSHIMEQVETVCDRVGILDRGELVAEDTIAALRAATNGGAQFSVTVEEMSSDLVDRVRALSVVTDVSREGQTIRASLADQTGKAAVMNEIARAGVRFVDFETTEESLEDLFAAYTGGGRDGQRQKQAGGEPLRLGSQGRPPEREVQQ